MRVALVGGGSLTIPPDGWGAMERVIWNLHQGLKEAGFDPAIVNVRSDADLQRELDSIAPDLVHLHADWRLEACLRALVLRPAPLVLTSHDWRLSREIPSELIDGLKLADSVIALSPAIGDRVRTVRTGQVDVIPNGVDTHVFRPIEKRPNSVLAVGRHAPRKRFGEIARFFAARPAYQLTLCGPGLRGGGRQRAPAIPAAPNITLLDNQPESAVARLMGGAEFFVHLAEHEASSLVIREAMACGCRVWTRPALAQDLTNVAFSWEEAVADAGLGERAAREAAGSFDWASVVRRHALVYEETLGRWRASPSMAAGARERYQRWLVRTAGPAGQLARARRRIVRWVRRRLPQGFD